VRFWDDLLGVPACLATGRWLDIDRVPAPFDPAESSSTGQRKTHDGDTRELSVTPNNSYLHRLSVYDGAGGRLGIDIDALCRPKGQIPEVFLQGAGVSDEMITSIKPLVGWVPSQLTVVSSQ
jgi:hypothetical protein